MGNTGYAGIPQLHVEIRDGTGNAIPVGICPWSGLVVGAADTHRTIATTTGNGTWTIDNAGQVTPTGQPGPTITYGTDSGG